MDGVFPFLSGEGKSLGIAIAPCTSPKLRSAVMLLLIELVPVSKEVGGHRFRQVLLRFYNKFL